MALQDDVMALLFGVPLSQLKRVPAAQAAAQRAETQRVLESDLKATGVLAAVAAGGAVLTSAGAAAGAGLLTKLATGASIKTVLGSAVTVMGTATFVNFISEEALQTAGMACFVAKGAQNPVALRAALDNYEALYGEAKKQAALTTWLSPFTKAQFDSNLMATASAIDAYEAALSNMKKSQAATLAARWDKNKLATLKATNAVYEKNALEAMNSGELALGEQWLEKIEDASARLKARGRVVKAAAKTWKAAVTAALKAADVAEAWRVLGFIPDAAVKASMQGKITDFEAKVEAKASRAAETYARKQAAAKNTEEMEALRTAYFASLPQNAVSEAKKAQVLAAGASRETSMQAQGGVYYSKATGDYSVATAGGLMHTTNAAQAAAWSQAAGGKATAAGLAAGRST